MGLETIAIASLIAAVSSSVVAGTQAHRAAGQQADQLKLQQQASATQAAVEEENRQLQLKRTLATQMAIFAGSNIDVGSGTPLTIAQDTFNLSAQQSKNAAILGQAQQGLLGMQIDDSLGAGRWAVASYGLAGISSALKGGQNLLSIGSTPSTGGSTVIGSTATTPLASSNGIA
jgi:hypothetical protein